MDKRPIGYIPGKGTVLYKKLSKTHKNFQILDKKAPKS